MNPRLKDVIRYRDHQEKFEIASPTPEQMTVEVCEFATDPGPARMNQQQIRLLEACLPRGHFVKLMTKVLGEVIFHWKNPDFLFRNVDFLLKNVDFLLKNVGFIIYTGAQ